MKRTFIAVKIEAGDPLKRAFAKAIEALAKESVKWVDINQLHITLAFIGDTSEESIQNISKMLREVCPGTGILKFTIRELGVFRSLNDPRVIWAGITEEKELSVLRARIKAGLEREEIIIEDRDFKPHLTLGRIKWLKNRTELGRLLAEFQSVVFQEALVKEVIFYESILQQNGPKYLPVSRISLA